MTVAGLALMFSRLSLSLPSVCRRREGFATRFEGLCLIRLDHLRSARGPERAPRLPRAGGFKMAEAARKCGAAGWKLRRASRIPSERNRQPENFGGLSVRGVTVDHQGNAPSMHFYARRRSPERALRGLGGG